MRRALLIIDVQEGMCSGPEACYDIERMLSVINNLSKRARQSNDVLVVLVQHEEAGSDLENGSPGWQLAHDLITSKEDIIVSKETPDSFHKTQLCKVLEDHQIENLIICGLQSDYCVDTTTRRALSLGYNVELIQDGHSTEDNTVLKAAQITAHHNVTLGAFTSFEKQVTLVKGEDVSF